MEQSLVLMLSCAWFLVLWCLMMLLVNFKIMKFLEYCCKTKSRVKSLYWLMITTLVKCWCLYTLLTVNAKSGVWKGIHRSLRVVLLLSCLLLLSLHLVRPISLQFHNMQFGRRSLFSTIFKKYNRKLTRGCRSCMYSFGKSRISGKFKDLCQLSPAQSSSAGKVSEIIS